ncbi:hypothetical protein NKG94_02370 [Micromonospora sp. M12]
MPTEAELVDYLKQVAGELQVTVPGWRHWNSSGTSRSPSWA